MSAAAANGLDALQGLVRDCAAAGVGRRVLLVRADLLPPRLTQPHHLRLARAALNPLMTAERARAHDLPDGRMAISWRGNAPAPLQQSLTALEHLFGDGFHIGTAALQSLVRLFDLPENGAELLAAAGLAHEAAPAPRCLGCPAAAARAVGHRHPVGHGGATGIGRHGPVRPA